MANLNGSKNEKVGAVGDMGGKSWSQAKQMELQDAEEITPNPPRGIVPPTLREMDTR